MNRNPLFCHKCGSEIRPGREYCDACGASAREASMAAQNRAGAHAADMQQLQNRQYMNQSAYQQAPAYDNQTAELSRKIDILQSNQAVMMQNMENMLKKYAKKRSTCIAVLGILLGIFVLACIILVFALIFITSDTVKTVIGVIDELYILLQTYGSKIDDLMMLLRDFL